MAQFRDWSGWMASTEETTPDEESEKKALRTVINTLNDPDEIAEVAMALGIDHHIRSI